MLAQKDHGPNDRWEEEAPERHAIRQQIDRQQRGRQKRRHGGVRKVQPNGHERAEAEAHRGQRAGELRVPPAAIEKGEGERDENLPRPLRRHGVAQLQRQREQAQRRKGAALAVRQQRLPRAGRLVPERDAQRLPLLARLVRPRHHPQRHVVEERIGHVRPRTLVAPRQQPLVVVDRNVDAVRGQRPEEKEEDERVEEKRDARRNPLPGAPRKPHRGGVRDADVDPSRIHLQCGSPNR